MSDEEEGRPLAVSLLRLALGTVAVVAIGLGAGWLFGRTAPDRAASTIVSNLTVEVETPTVEATTAVVCGLRDRPLTEREEAAALEAGLVVVAFAPDVVDDGGLGELKQLTVDHPSALVVAPDPELQDPVRARTLRRRMSLESVRPELLTAFAREHAVAASPAPCAPDG